MAKIDLATIASAVAKGDSLMIPVSINLDAASLKALHEFMDMYEIAKAAPALQALVLAGLTHVPQLITHKAVARRLMYSTLQHMMNEYRDALSIVYQKLKSDLDANDPRSLLVLLGEMQPTGETSP